MQEYIYLATGVIILLLVIFDFFYTTISGSGAGPVTEKVSIFSDKIIKSLANLLGRNAYKCKGLFINLMTLLVWILLVWGGLFLLYSWNPEAITNSDGRVANHLERLYYAGYIISTLGMGNFKPTSGFFEIITSLFAFFGFIFFTSSMTYFISVSSAIVNKRTLTKSIFNLGESPQEISGTFQSFDTSYAYQQLLKFQEMVDRHSVNHHAYPVIHFYTESDPRNCFSLNITRLDEALSILIGSDQGKKLQKEIAPLRSSITHFLQNIEKNFSQSVPRIKNPVDPSIFPYAESVILNNDLEKRRSTLEKLFTGEGFQWVDINYDQKKKEKV